MSNAIYVFENDCMDPVFAEAVADRFGVEFDLIKEFGVNGWAEVEFSCRDRDALVECLTELDYYDIDEFIEEQFEI